MKRLLFLLVLLNTFCFSMDGFKEFKWGSTPKEIMGKMGEKEIIDEKLIYKNIEFDGINLEYLLLDFKDNKLIGWSGRAKCKAEEIAAILNEFENKYGKLEFEEKENAYWYSYSQVGRHVSFIVKKTSSNTFELNMLYTTEEALKRVK